MSEAMIIKDNIKRGFPSGGTFWALGGLSDGPRSKLTILCGRSGSERRPL